MNGDILKKCFKDTIPVAAGYLVLGIGFGIVMNTVGYGLLPTAAMSLFVYAGSMQYAAIGLMASHASLAVLAVTTLAVNARHFFYGLSMLGKYKGKDKRLPYMIFALTDETYSLVIDESRDLDYCFTVSVLDHIYWVTGSVLGSILGGVIEFNSNGIDFALTALFVTVFVDQWMSGKDRISGIIGVVATVLARILFGRDAFLIPAMLLITLSLLGRITLFERWGQREEAKHE